MELQQEAEEKDYTYFSDAFYAELDSWFSADIKCCEICYNDFIESWPIALDRLPDFCMMDVMSFYSGSHLQEWYTEQEYRKNLYQIKCPRCYSSIESWFYAFEFSFDNFSDLEWEFYQLKQSIKLTPFMTLKIKLATDILEILERMFTKTRKIRIEGPLFRGRVLNRPEVGFIDLLPPPSEQTNEGRYNHLGVPVIYAASNEITCYNELRRPADHIYICSLKIEEEVRLLDLTTISDTEDEILSAIVISSLMSAKATDDARYKPEYYFTRFISDCCRFLTFGGIIYPSAQAGEGQNYMFFDLSLMNEENMSNLHKFEFNRKILYR